jgi:hypothetical protein
MQSVGYVGRMWKTRIREEFWWANLLKCSFGSSKWTWLSKTQITLF